MVLYIVSYTSYSWSGNHETKGAEYFTNYDSALSFFQHITDKTSVVEARLVEYDANAEGTYIMRAIINSYGY